MGLFLLLVTVSVACKEKEGDKNGWTVCNSCTIESWKGTFSGASSYFDAATLSTAENIEITIDFEETATDYLTAYVAVPNYFNATISGELSSSYSISFAGSTSSLNATMQTKEEALKLSGTVKKFHMKIDSLVIDEVVSFEATKIAQ